MRGHLRRRWEASLIMALVASVTLLGNESAVRPVRPHGVAHLEVAGTGAHIAAMTAVRASRTATLPPNDHLRAMPGITSSALAAVCLPGQALHSQALRTVPSGALSCLANDGASGTARAARPLPTGSLSH